MESIVRGVAAFMELFAQVGLTVFLKIDHERSVARNPWPPRPWTVLVSNPDRPATARGDCRSLEECLRLMPALAAEVTPDPPAAPDPMAPGTGDLVEELLGQLGTHGITLLAQVGPASPAGLAWSVLASGPGAVPGLRVEGRPTLAAGLTETLRDLRGRHADWDWLDLYF